MQLFGSARPVEFAVGDVIRDRSTPTAPYAAVVGARVGKTTRRGRTRYRFAARQREQFPPQSCDLADRSYRQSKKPGLLPSGGRVAGPKHDDFRADLRAVVEIDDVLVRQADTAGRGVGANGPGFIGAVDAV